MGRVNTGRSVTTLRRPRAGKVGWVLAAGGMRAAIRRVWKFVTPPIPDSNGDSVDRRMAR